MGNFYQKHVFFCTNQKADGKKCCADADAEAFFTYAKKRLVELNQHGEGKIRVSKSGPICRTIHLRLKILVLVFLFMNRISILFWQGICLLQRFSMVTWPIR